MYITKSSIPTMKSERNVRKTTFLQNFSNHPVTRAKLPCLTSIKPTTEIQKRISMLDPAWTERTDSLHLRWLRENHRWPSVGMLEQLGHSISMDWRRFSFVTERWARQKFRKGTRNCISLHVCNSNVWNFFDHFTSHNYCKTTFFFSDLGLKHGIAQFVTVKQFCNNRKTYICRSFLKMIKKTSSFLSHLPIGNRTTSFSCVSFWAGYQTLEFIAEKTG